MLEVILGAAFLVSVVKAGAEELVDKSKEIKNSVEKNGVKETVANNAKRLADDYVKFTQKQSEELDKLRKEKENEQNGTF